MAKTSPEKLAAALRANLARRKAGPKAEGAIAPAKSPKSPQNGGPKEGQSNPSKPRPGPKPA
jgi:hypothetical protein